MGTFTYSDEAVAVALILEAVAISTQVGTMANLRIPILKKREQRLHLYWQPSFRIVQRPKVYLKDKTCK